MAVSEGKRKSIEKLVENTRMIQTRLPSPTKTATASMLNGPKIGLLLQCGGIGKPLRDCEDYLNEIPAILDVFGLEKSPDHTSFWNRDKEFSTRKWRSLLHSSAEQAGISGTEAIDASGFQRDQTNSHYRKRAGYSFQKLKSTLLVDTESLVIMDAHFTAKKAYDGHIGLQVLQRNAEDLQELLGDKMYSWKALREGCREESTHPVIKHCEQSSLQKAHNARINEDLYHQRTMSETVFSLLKNDGGEKLRSRTWHRQFREMIWKCIVHNLSRAAG